MTAPPSLPPKAPKDISPPFLPAERPVRRLSLAQRFLIGSLVILLAGMSVIGVWVSRQIESRVIQRTATTTAL